MNSSAASHLHRIVLKCGAFRAIPRQLFAALGITARTDIMKLKTYKEGEIIIQKGEKNRDLFFLMDGVVEVSTEDEDGEYMLNEMRPPGIIGDFAFYYGMPRTATVKATTNVEVFILKYENLEYQVKELPELLKPIYTALVQRVELRDKKISELEKEILELKDKLHNTECDC